MVNPLIFKAKQVQKGYRISQNAEDIDFEVVYGFLSKSYWSKGIPQATLKSAIDNSLCFSVLYLASHDAQTTPQATEQIGFARVVTDKATFAYLADVFILESHRGKGLAQDLIKHIVEHHELQGLRRFMLATSDAHGLYEKFGFKALEKIETLMQVWDPNVYQNKG